MFDKVDFLMPIATTVNAGQDDLVVFDKVEFLMLIATTVLVAGKKNKNTKKLKLTLQVALVGGAYSVKVWMKDQEDATFH